MTRRPPVNLVAARRSDLTAKRDFVRAATHRIHNAGHRVTIARVAREAQVSTSFVYNAPELLSAVREAIRDQLDSGPESHPTPATSHSKVLEDALFSYEEENGGAPRIAPRKK